MTTITKQDRLNKLYEQRDAITKRIAKEENQIVLQAGKILHKHNLTNLEEKTLDKIAKLLSKLDTHHAITVLTNAIKEKDVQSKSKFEENQNPQPAEISN